MSAPFPRDRLEALLKGAYENSYSDFYRNRFPNGIENYLPLSPDGWESIPLLSRADINSVPFWKRVFVSRADVPFTRNTYGTSGKRIIILPRRISGNFDNPYREMKLKRIMNFFASGYHEFPRSAIPEMQMWFGDVSNLTMSAAIAARARIDSLWITPYTALLFAELLKTSDAIAGIRAVMLTGERCSPLQFDVLRHLYTGASVYGVYGSAETREGAAVACSHDREKGGSLVMEPMDGIYYELVVPDTGDVIEDEGVHGELVVSHIHKELPPFPLIRYRTGDIAVYRGRECDCETESRGFEVLGRDSVFPVRLAKGELTVDAIECALIHLPNIRTDYFEIHYNEEAARGVALPRVHLDLVLSGVSALSRKRIASKIASDLLVFPTYSYERGVRDGIYLPLTVSFINAPPPSQLGKGITPVVIRHFGNTHETQQTTLEKAR